MGLDDLIPVKDEPTPHTVRDILHDLHPAVKDPVEESLLKDTPSNSLPFDPILFKSLDGSRIRDSALLRICRPFRIGLLGLAANVLFFQTSFSRAVHCSCRG